MVAFLLVYVHGALWFLLHFSEICKLPLKWSKQTKNQKEQVIVMLKEDFNNIHPRLSKIMFNFAISLSLFSSFSQELALLLCLGAVCEPARLCSSVCEAETQANAGIPKGMLRFQVVSSAPFLLHSLLNPLVQPLHSVAGWVTCWLCGVRADCSIVVLSRARISCRPPQGHISPALFAAFDLNLSAGH